MLITMCINIMLAVSLHISYWITGQFSIGHAGFMAVGAYIIGNCYNEIRIAISSGNYFRRCCCALAGLLVGIPTLRLKGDYLAIATLRFCRNYSNYIFKY